MGDCRCACNKYKFQENDPPRRAGREFVRYPFHTNPQLASIKNSLSSQLAETTTFSSFSCLLLSLVIYIFYRRYFLSKRKVMVMFPTNNESFFMMTTNIHKSSTKLKLKLLDLLSVSALFFLSI